MPNLDTRFLADVCQELARQRRLFRSVKDDPFPAVQLRYHDVVSKGYAHADAPCDETQAALYSAAVALAAAAMRLGTEGSPHFHYVAQHAHQEAANAN